ncbi:IMP dehydrogenase [Myxococcota bacterium]|nr:IMP dehydrogenase [Myxococcota bacterium]MBU1381908.1 IMP dehydrogenase [Myxococcota bacterium]MBU1497809.1 IMP dehydrogenase [Myxococcota bacterium]
MIKNFREALTFDDVLIKPAFSEVLPSETCISTELTPQIKLKIPFISAAMDTVTEFAMAQTMAHQGGIGIIHKNLSPEAQSEQVRRVKRSESWIILNPVSIKPDHAIKDALELMTVHSISGLPVLNENGIPVGIVTARDVRFENDLSRKVSEIMTRNLVTAAIDTPMDTALELLHHNRIEKLILLNSDNSLGGLLTLRDLQNREKFPDSAKDNRGRLLVGAAAGISDREKKRVELLVSAGVDVICIDTAHGHTRGVGLMIEWIRSKWPDLQIIAGNIATGEAASWLINTGVNALKVGIGPGSICTTRIVSGIGVPQLTAIMDVHEIASKFDIPVIADGGIKYSGDIVKALAAGASSVMMGSMFAGTDETPGETILYQGRSYKQYRGMGSLGAMREGSADRYFQADSPPGKLVPEGIEGRVPSKGPVSQTIAQLSGGLRSGMGYVGARNINELRQNTEFVRISNAGLKESHVHDVIITKEAPNYKMN